MGIRITLAVVGSILLLGLGSRARADDAPAEDAAALLRRARVAETVDHDLPKAMDLYRKVFAAAGDSDTSRDAALHLMDLLEARGDRPGALGFAKELSDRFTTRLDDAMKRQVHETMARTLPAGSHAKSPLGDVYVLPAPGSVSNPSPSPLESKIQAILSRLDSVEERNRASAEMDVLSALAPVGRDAVPALERAMNDARPERARFAAQAIATIAPNVALPIFLRAIKEGDGFARGAASGGLEAIVPSPEISADFIVAVEPLLDLPVLAPRASSLLDALVKHMDAAACLDRFDKGGPRAVNWLASAGEKSPLETAERIVRLATSPAPIATFVAEVAGNVAGASNQPVAGNWQWVPSTPGLSSAKRAVLLEAVVRTKATAEVAGAATRIAHAIMLTGDAGERLAAASIAWSFALEIDLPELRLQTAEALVVRGITPTLPVFEKPSRAARFEEAVAAILVRPMFQQSPTEIAKALFPIDLFGVPALWAAVERLTASASASPASSNALLRLGQRLGDSLPPPSEDVRWLRVLSRTPGLAIAWMRRAAGRFGDPKVLEIARADLARSPPDSGDSWPLDLVATYRGPGRGAFALDVLETRQAQGWGVLEWGRGDPQFWPVLAERLGTYAPAQRKKMLSIVATGTGSTLALPPESDTAWLAELRRPAPPDLQICEPIVAAAARSGSPEYVAILRELIADADKEPSAYLRPMIRHLKEYGGPDRLAVLVELLSDPKNDGLLTKYVSQEVWEALAAEPDRAAVGAALDRIARDPVAPGNGRAISRYYVPEKRDELVAIFHAMEKPGTFMREDYRTTLILLAQRLHLKEAIPFLLKEYREGRPLAATALDDIRTFYDRIRAFEGAADGHDPLATEIDAVTKGPTVELRRAAVFALAATHGVKAVPALLEIARTTADEPVRTAAIEMIEKLARGAPAADAPKASTPATSGKDEPAPSR